MVDWSSQGTVMLAVAVVALIAGIAYGYRLDESDGGNDWNVIPLRR